MKTNKNILYVEDDEIISEAFVMFFEKIHNIFQASNGKEGLEKFNNLLEIDLIITDISMPIMNGLEMVRKIREENKEIPIYTLTAFFDSKLHIEECLKLNVNRIISKPLNVKDILDYIEEDL